MATLLQARRAVRSSTQATASYPTTPVRQFSFTDFSTNNPTTPQPGNNLDSEYDRTNASVSQTISYLGVSLNTDGTLKSGSVGSQQLAPGIFDFIAQDAINQVQPLVDDAQAYANSASSSSSTAATSSTSASGSATTANGAANTAQTAATAAGSHASDAQSYANIAQSAASAAANSDNHATGQANLSNDLAVVAEAWAEHMPDTIPPNILAVMGITGDHWSSRWWANQADGIVSGAIDDINQAGDDLLQQLQSFYLGAFSVPPTGDSLGNPVALGALYYDLVLGAMYVWNGTSWQPASSSAPVQTSRTIYVATAGQTVFSGPDRDGNTLVFNPQTLEQAAVFKTGALLTPTTDYVTSANTVTLTAPAAAGNIVQIWVETVPVVKLDWRTARLDTTSWVLNGTNTQFPLRDSQGATLLPSSSSDLLLSLDGVWQEAQASYTVSSSTLTFPVAPPSDAHVFGIAVVPVPDVPSPQPGVTAMDTSGWVFDGVAVTFPIVNLSQTPVVPAAAENLLLSLNGIWQAAIQDYTVTGSTVTFLTAPEPDAHVFGVVGLPAFAGA
jgi:hypothetical protein